MPGWITHTIITDTLLRRLPALDARGFCIGSIAPDCNIENAADYDGFWALNVAGRTFASAEEYAFLCGYYAHLVTDVAFQQFSHSDAHVAAMFARVKAEPSLAAQIAGQPETFATLKAAFGRDRLFAGIAHYEAQYLADHPGASYLTILRQTTAFPDYLDFLPPGAIPRKIGIMAVLPEGTAADAIFFPPAEYARFLDQTSSAILGLILDKQAALRGAT